jgi:hypothetical protein
VRLCEQQESVIRERIRLLAEAYPVAPEHSQQKLAHLELIESALRQLAKLQAAGLVK